jgi:hypothetical protein
VKPPSAEAEPERYRGRPLLIILENYVLSAIDELDPEKNATMLPIVQRVYGGGDDWRGTIRAQLHLGDGLDESLRRLWARNQEIAAREGTSLQPVQFAKMIVDENWSSLVDPITP